MSALKLRLTNAILLSIVAVMSLFMGKSKQCINNPKNVVIFNFMKMGDMVCATPVFHAIKQRYPNCQVVVVGNRVNKELLEYNRDVDNYIVHGSSIYKTVKEVRKLKPDFGCTIGPNFPSLAMLYLSGIKTIAVPVVVNGYSPYETRPYKIIRSLVITVAFRLGEYMPLQYLRLLGPIGIKSENTQKHLSHSKDADIWSENFLNRKNLEKSDFIIGIAVSAGTQSKVWHTEKFAKLISHLISEHNAKVIVIGSKGDHVLIKKLFSYLETPQNIVDGSGTSIDRLKALISRLDLFISSDTGPIYIAEAYGMPTVDIVGPMDEREQPPVGKLHKVVVPKRSEPQLHILNARKYNERELLRQTEDTTVDMVVGVVDGLIDEIQK